MLFRLGALMLCLSSCAVGGQPFLGLRTYDVGAMVNDLPDNLQRSIGSKRGVLVGAVALGSPAQKAGLSKLDMITMVDGAAVATYDAWKAATAKMVTGESYTMRVLKPSIRGRSIRWRSSTAKLTPVDIVDWAAQHVTVDEDRLSGTKIIEPRALPDTTRNTGFYVRIVKTGGRSQSIVRFHWAGDDWLFVNKVELFSFPNFSVSSAQFANTVRDVTGRGTVWEHTDVALSADLKQSLLGMLKKPIPVIRFTGNKYRDDHNVSDAERYSALAVLAIAGEL